MHIHGLGECKTEFSTHVNLPYTAKLSRLCTKHTIHWKIFAVHQAHAIMYCTHQGENFRDRLKNRESFPPRKFCRIRYLLAYLAVRSALKLSWQKVALPHQMRLTIVAYQVRIEMCFYIKPCRRTTKFIIANNMGYRRVDYN